MAKFLEQAGVSRLWEKIKAYIDSKVSFVQTAGYWSYRINNDGTFEAWYSRTGVSFTVTYASGNFYRSDPLIFALPSALDSATVSNVQAQVFHTGFPTFGAVSSLDPIKVQALSGANRGTNSNYVVVIYVFGTI